MAIVVKGKKCLCKTFLSDWSPERVNGVWFYNRYKEFVRLFSAKIPEIDFEKCFAQPVLNAETNSIEWFSFFKEELCTLSEIFDESANQEKERIIRVIENAVKNFSDDDKKYLTPILQTLKSDKIDNVTYHCNGQVVFGIWGMLLKPGKTITEVIIDDIKDHRIYRITYEAKGGGKLAFSEIVRRFGHVLSGPDIPTYTALDGYIVKEWIPESPYGVKVDRPLMFTLVFEKNQINDPKPLVNPLVPTDEDEPKEPDKPFERIDPTEYNVRFISDERGTLLGKTEYLKKENDCIFAYEVPRVESKKGYRFLGWDKNPIDYIVKNDVEFVAQYEKIEEPDIVDPIIDNVRNRFWGSLSNWLSWLLAFLLLGLIGFLLWFLLGNHNINFCDCDCNDPIPSPVQKDCNEVQRQGSNSPESFIFDMGKDGGSFLLEYDTGNLIADLIVVYDGDTRNSKEIFRFYGITDTGIRNEVIQFTGKSILVDIIPDQSPDTYWSVKVNCP